MSGRGLSPGRRFVAPLSRVTALVALLAATAMAAPVYFEIYADQDRASLDPLAPFDIRFIVHANGNSIQGMVFPMHLKFSNGNILGTMGEWPNGDATILYSPASNTAFHSKAFNQSYGDDPTSPDTMLLGLTSFGAPWTGSGEVFRIRFTPRDTGTIKFDTFGCCLPPSADGDPVFLDPNGQELPYVMWNPVIRVPPLPGTVRFRISTSSGTDTLFFGVPGTIYFNVDATGNEIALLDFGFKWQFTHGNFIGPFSDLTGEIQYSPVALDVFESIVFGPYRPQGTNPDTSLVGFIDYDTDTYSGSGWIWSLTFQPLDTGTVVIDSNFNHPPSWVNIFAGDQVAAFLPANFIPGRIAVVPCPYDLMGDVNQDALITSSDLIYFINYIFKSGPDPLPERSIGDVNCSAGLGASDIIYLVNYIFKSGAPPCACIVRRI